MIFQIMLIEGADFKMINIGVAQWCLSQQGVDAIFQSASLGLSVIQIDAGGDEGAPFLDSPIVQAAYLRAARETEVKISAIGINLLNFYGMTNPIGSNASNECWNMIQLAINAAKRMHVDLVFLPSFDEGEIRDDIGLLRTAKLLSMACDIADEHHIVVASENTLGINENRKLLTSVNRPNFKILLDTLNPVLWGYQVPEMIRGLWRYMCNQIHAKDGINGNMGNAPLNTGQANFSETVATLFSLNFNGYFILENEYKQQAKKRLKEDINTLRMLWREQGQH